MGSRRRGGLVWAIATLCVGMLLGVAPEVRAQEGAQAEEACPRGKARTARTAGQCCWPGQVYDQVRERCVGKPTHCLEGGEVSGHSCVWRRGHEVRATPELPAPVVASSPEEAKLNALVAKAQQDVLTSKPKRAIATCLGVLKRDPKMTQCHRILGMAYRSTGDVPRACKHFGEALKSKPSNQEAIQNMLATMSCK